MSIPILKFDLRKSLKDYGLFEKVILWNEKRKLLKQLEKLVKSGNDFFVRIELCCIEPLSNMGSAGSSTECIIPLQMLEIKGKKSDLKKIVLAVSRVGGINEPVS